MEYYFLIKGKNRYSAILPDGSTFNRTYEWEGHNKRLVILENCGLAYKIKTGPAAEKLHKLYAIGGNFHNNTSSNVIVVTVSNISPISPIFPISAKSPISPIFPIFPISPRSEDTAKGRLKGRLRYARCNTTGVICKNELYVIGGMFDSNILESVEKYDKKIKRFHTVHSLNIPRQCASACAYLECIYVAGGSNEFGLLSSIEKYDGRGWVVLNVSLPYPMMHFYIESVYSSKLIVWGGRARNINVLKEMWSIDLYSGQKQFKASPAADQFRYPGHIIPFPTESTQSGVQMMAVTLNSERRLVSERLFPSISSQRMVFLISCMQLESFNLI